MERLADNIIEGDRRALSKAITLVESTRADHRQQADELLMQLMPHTGKSLRIGITGAPGVGKSTFIEALGNTIADQGHKLAVLAIDPSSWRTGGSILGDKTRMETLTQRQEVFIRPSPSGGFLGGVARRSLETMFLCEAAGFDVTLIETVGVGQSETKVSDMVDIFLLMLLPGGGDELQGIKRGIVEQADLMIVNKADGGSIDNAERTATNYRNALKLLQPRHENWTVPVLTCSALEKTGIELIWQTITTFCERIEADETDIQRQKQALTWMWEEVSYSLVLALHEDEVMWHKIETYEQQVKNNNLPPSLAARKMVGEFLANQTKKADK